MKFKIALAGLCMLALAAVATAQNKISGAAQCIKPDIEQKVDIPDHPGHMLSISQGKCAWSKPLEVAGVKSKDGVSSGVADMHGATGSSHGYYTDNMENGDKAYVRWHGTVSKDGDSGKWRYLGGTGKFKGLKGGGTYKSKRAEDGSASLDVEGEYTLPE